MGSIGFVTLPFVSGLKQRRSKICNSSNASYLTRSPCSVRWNLISCVNCKASVDNRRVTKDNSKLTLKVIAMSVLSFVQLLSGQISSPNHLGTQMSSFQTQPVLAAGLKVKKNLKSKLSQVPVFAVTNSDGQPYLVEDGNDKVQKGYIFFSPEDAGRMMTKVKQANGTEDIQIHVIGLDKAYEMVSNPPTSSGLKDEEGRELMMTFLLHPDSEQVQKARELLKREKKKPAFDGIPVFVARGLMLRKGDESNVPVFLDKDDLELAWKRLRESDKSLPQHPVIEIADLFQLLKEIEKGDKEELRSLGFFASRKSIEWIRNHQSKS
ncbi:Protein TIC 22, chloroplastic [Galdieria sulphuraria]|uniref:Chloroplast inner membrane import protein Tic22 n=1 Tax=Galdieria sulphuraria TaxID=130081 RepID=M2XPU8_GALSU|nr:chloroplast inner membrane import protein Tic22 [Galdieria sulphuraria]EME32242.1 chloroplast inner membrane import protein Tic22 [Galdieria sulphuraria]GJD09667.1 Protein TIC 22, chloroplastic [Galdieria sulphuraria]|eukprot:XP_005708762.1 chloroplast inner membrane import protein Tic22 [Galdieria sulphuraria]